MEGSIDHGGQGVGMRLRMGWLGLEGLKDERDMDGLLGHGVQLVLNGDAW